MRKITSSHLLSALCLVFAISACSDANAPSRTVTESEVTADLARSAGDAIAGDIHFLRGGELDAMSFIAPPGGPQHGTADCSLGDDGRHTCTGTTMNGLTHTRSFAFYDANSALQSRFDPITTASINFQMTVSGTIERDRVTATIARERNSTLSGLIGTETERTWNGTGSGTHNSVATGDRGTRTYVTTSHDTTTNVVFAVPRAENPWPKSGTAVHRMSSVATFEGPRSGTRTVTRRAVVTFNGTSTVPLQMGERTCTLNLETKAVSCPGGR